MDQVIGENLSGARNGELGGRDTTEKEGTKVEWRIGHGHSTVDGSNRRMSGPRNMADPEDAD